MEECPAGPDEADSADCAPTQIARSSHRLEDLALADMRDYADFGEDMRLYHTEYLDSPSGWVEVSSRSPGIPQIRMGPHWGLTRYDGREIAVFAPSSKVAAALTAETQVVDKT